VLDAAAVHLSAGHASPARAALVEVALLRLPEHVQAALSELGLSAASVAMGTALRPLPAASSGGEMLCADSGTSELGSAEDMADDAVRHHASAASAAPFSPPVDHIFAGIAGRASRAAGRRQPAAPAQSPNLFGGIQGRATRFRPGRAAAAPASAAAAPNESKSGGAGIFDGISGRVTRSRARGK